MNKHTPQEWADITGCYVARDEGKSCFNIYEVKPVRNYKRNWWSNPGGDFGELPTAAVPEEYYSDDWSILYGPHNKSEGCYTDQAESDNKRINSKSGESCQKSDLCPHSGEVYTQKEYCILGHGIDRTLAKLVIKAMEEGWKPLGGVAVEHLSTSDGYATDSSFFYQAMVRGV